MVQLALSRFMFCSISSIEPSMAALSASSLITCIFAAIRVPVNSGLLHRTQDGDQLYRFSQGLVQSGLRSGKSGKGPLVGLVQHLDLPEGSPSWSRMALSLASFARRSWSNLCGDTAPSLNEKLTLPLNEFPEHRSHPAVLVVPAGADGNIHCISRADPVVDVFQFGFRLDEILAKYGSPRGLPRSSADLRSACDFAALPSGLISSMSTDREAAFSTLMFPRRSSYFICSRSSCQFGLAHQDADGLRAIACGGQSHWHGNASFCNPSWARWLRHLTRAASSISRALVKLETLTPRLIASFPLSSTLPLSEGERKIVASAAESSFRYWHHAELDESSVSLKVAGLISTPPSAVSSSVARRKEAGLVLIYKQAATAGTPRHAEHTRQNQRRPLNFSWRALIKNAQGKALGEDKHHQKRHKQRNNHEKQYTQTQPTRHKSPIVPTGHSRKE